MNFNKAVKAECARQGVTLSALAEKIGVNRKTMYSVCSGEPTIKSVSRIAAALGVKCSELIAMAEECK